MAVRILRLVTRKSSSSQFGGQAIVDHLVQIIFIQAVGDFATGMPENNGGWLGAVMDPDIGPVLAAMHGRLEWPWTVALLAKRARMSRSVFAAQFKTLLSKPPQQYLLECRMRKACELLVDGEDEIKRIREPRRIHVRGGLQQRLQTLERHGTGAYRRSRPAEAAALTISPAY